MCPNNLLYWEIIQKACQEKMEVLDFGRSMKNSGSLAFKLGWGAQRIPQPCYLYSNRPETLKLSPNQKGISIFVNQWRRLPRSWADRLGPVICHNIASLM